MNESHSNSKDRFEIGGEDFLSVDQAPSVPAGARSLEPLTPSLPREKLENIRVRIGTLLKTETVSFLLGAGASVDCGGQLIGAVPLAVERDLQNKGTTSGAKPRLRYWLTLFYSAVRHCADDTSTPVTRDEILARRNTIESENAEPLKANFEEVLAVLHRWRVALPAAGGRLRVEGFPGLDARSEDLDECLKHATRTLARACNLPTLAKKDDLVSHKTLIRKLLTRPLNLKRVNIFTLNYDTLVEQAADAEGVVLLDGFVGTQRRIFRPESYEQDLYFPAETTEGRVHRFDRVLHLYKLHGSITWTAAEPTIDDPHGVHSGSFEPDGSQSLLIYPTPAKYGEALGMPYAELFRRFAVSLARPQSVLFVVGYGFGDKHVNAIIRQALAVPSFTLVIVDPAPKSTFVKSVREQKDRRVWIAEGQTLGMFSGFVQHILPDLRDEEIRQKVLTTYRVLVNDGATKGVTPDGNRL